MQHRDLDSRLSSIRKAIRQLSGSLSVCNLCPRSCRVDRTAGELGFCQAGMSPKVFRFAPHHGEEPPISGTRGSGTVFLSHCTMSCIYCQNWRFSQKHEGREVQPAELCDMMLKLQDAGCHNVNLVTPTHFLPQTLEALELAAAKGFALPIVYNTSSYERVETIEALSGVVDIYLADARYASPDLAHHYSGAPDYVVRSRNALKAMWHQVGPLVVNDDDVAESGLIIRHLALPGHVDDSKRVLEWIATELSGDVAVSLMSQYRPAYEAVGHPSLGRRLSPSEFEQTLEYAKARNFDTLFVQPPDSDFPDDLFGERMKDEG